MKTIAVSHNFDQRTIGALTLSEELFRLISNCNGDMCIAFGLVVGENGKLGEVVEASLIHASEIPKEWRKPI